MEVEVLLHMNQRNVVAREELADARSVGGFVARDVIAVE